MHPWFQRIFMSLMAVSLLPGLAMAAAISATAVAPGDNGAERVVFTTDGAITPIHQFTLSAPDRVVIDIPHARATGIALPADYHGGFIKNIRYGQFDPTTSRLVIEVTAAAKIVKAGPDGNNQLVVEIVPVDAAAVPAATATTATAAPVSPFVAVDTPNAIPVVTDKKKPLIVIDPGHGGQDPGALGRNDVHEKDVTLAMARAVKEGLLRTGHYRVILTRDTDVYIPLQGRVDIARNAKADLFISLHADSNPKADARGLSIYTLSEHASDDEAAALAERENKSDIIAGLDLGTADQDVASILIDLTQRETMNKSSVFADTVVGSLHPKIHTLPSPHRFAGFRVLKAPDIPSVLIEMGFISNAQDEQLLTSHEYRDILVASLVKALDKYTADK